MTLYELYKVTFFPRNKTTLIIDTQCDFMTITEDERINKIMYESGYMFNVDRVYLNDDGSAEIHATIKDGYPKDDE